MCLGSVLINLNITKKFISHIYQKLQSLDQFSIDKITSTWERDHEIQPCQEEWSKVFLLSNKIFTFNRFKESQYRILHRTQHTPQFLHKCSLNISPLCKKCQKGRDLISFNMAMPCDCSFLEKC